MAEIYFIKAMEALELNKGLLKKDSKKKRSDMAPTFFLGAPGIYTMGALLHLESEGLDSKEAMEYAELVLSGKQLYENSPNIDMEDELLYGSSGYLYCLLLLKKKFRDKIKDKVDPVIVMVVDALIESGSRQDVNFLYYTFPKGNSPYLGAAHGTIGILYMLIKATQELPLLQYNSNLMTKVKNTLTMLIEQQTQNGAIPFCYNEPVSELKEPFHWCHGVPGSISLFLEAAILYKDESYTQLALTLGEFVWEKGLLKKGFGLCHGTCGNAYMLNALYKATGDSVWLHRAQRFLIFTGDPEIKQIVNNYKKSGFKLLGIPDTPYSLMEG